MSPYRYFQFTFKTVRLSFNLIHVAVILTSPFLHCEKSLLLVTPIKFPFVYPILIILQSYKNNMSTNN